MVKVEVVAGLGVLALLALAGCGSSYSATLSGVTPMPDDSVFGQGGGHLHTGIATAFTPLVTMHDAWGSHSETDGIAVQSSDPGVLRVSAVVNSAQAYPESSSSSGGTNGGAAGARWVIWAVSPGIATLTVEQSGNVALAVPVQVTDP